MKHERSTPETGPGEVYSADDADGGTTDASHTSVPRRSVLRAIGAGALAGGLLGAGGAGSASAASAAHDYADPSAATHRATSNGAWADASTWEGGELPGDEAQVYVPSDVTVTLDHEDDARLTWVRVDGTLRFDPSTDTHLRAETVVTGTDSRLEIGTAENPIASGVSAEITFVDHGPIDESADPKRVSKGLISGNVVRVHGAATTPFLTLASHASAGDDTLQLSREPTNWTAGDELLVPSQEPPRFHDDGSIRDSSIRDEEVSIASIDGTTVTLADPLEYDHVPPADYDSYVLNATRNVRLTSETTDVSRRGHGMFMHDDVDVRYAHCRELGRTDKSYPFTNGHHGDPPTDVPPNPKARYPLHFHRTGATSETGPGRIVGCVVWGSPGWGIVNHHAYAHVTDCITYQVFGAGFVSEAGNEFGSFKRNFALRSEGSGETPDAREFRSASGCCGVDDFGHGGHGFWIHSPGVALEDNVAAGHRHYGIGFWMRALIDRPFREGERFRRLVGTIPNYPTELVEGQEALLNSDRVQDGKVPSSYVKFRSVQDNEVFASGAGLDVTRHMLTYRHGRVADHSVVEGFTAYNVGRNVKPNGRRMYPEHRGAQGGSQGISLRYSNNLVLKDVDLHTAEGDQGKGLNHHHLTGNVHLENGRVRNWKVGVQTNSHGDMVLADLSLDNLTNLDVRGATEATTENPSTNADGHEPRRIVLDDVSFAGGERADVNLGVDPATAVATDTGTQLDSRSLYDASAVGDHVPFPTPDAASAADAGPVLSALLGEAPVDVVGETTATVADDAGVTLAGDPAAGGEVPAAVHERVTTDEAAPDTDPGAEVELESVDGRSDDQDDGPPAIDGVVPTDPDDDGIYEDLNGNGEFDSNDVVTYFDNIGSDAMTENPAYFDANGNGNVDFDDIVTLFQSL